MSAARRHGTALGVGSCPACTAAEADVLLDHLPDRLGGRPGRWTIVGCRRCGLARTEPRPGADELAALYPAGYFHGLQDSMSPARAGPSRARRAVSGLVDAAFARRHGSTEVPAPPRAGAAVLDVGPGTGEELAQHARRGWVGWAVEPNAQAAHAVARRVGLPTDRTIVAPAEQVQLPSRHFDRVILSHVIEHFADPRVALRNVAESLRPGAIAVVRCPNFGSVERRLFGRWWSGLDVPRHLQHFDPRTLEALLNDCGLRVLRRRPQREYATPAVSLSLAAHATLGRALPDAPGARLGAVLLPLVGLGRVLGAAGNLEIEACRGEPSGHERSRSRPA